MSMLTQMQDIMKKEDLSLLYYDDPLAVSYLTGFESDPHERVLALFVFQEETWMLVPSLELNRARQVEACDLFLSYKDEESPWDILGTAIDDADKKVSNVGIEENSLSVARYKELKSIFTDSSFKDSTSLLQNLRVVKTDSEIEIMKKAGDYADKAVNSGMSALKNGITEEEVVAIIEYELKKEGIQEMSFPTMVLFGDHAASPHGIPGERKLKPNELVLFDLGVVYEGYTSDMTRTIAYGKVDDETKTIYDTVKEAQETAQASVKPGMKAEELDSIARTVIKKAGYGEYFTHRLGHGLGQSVHEYPDIAQNSTIELKEGMCFSLEPGIYIEGQVGIRIEDCVYVTNNASEPFTHTSKELIELPVID